MSKKRSGRGPSKHGSQGARRAPLIDVSSGIPWTRIGAYAIDWFLSGVLVGFPEVLVFNLVSGTHDMFSDLYVFPAMGRSAGWSYLCCALSLVVYLWYFVYVPLRVWPGQTPGKRACKLHVVRDDGGDVDLRTLLLRHVVGLLVVESTATIMGSYVRQTLTLATGVYLDGYLAVAGYVLLMVSGVLVVAVRGHRALHDHIAGTHVEHV